MIEQKSGDRKIESLIIATQDALRDHQPVNTVVARSSIGEQIQLFHYNLSPCFNNAAALADCPLTINCSTSTAMSRRGFALRGKSPNSAHSIPRNAAAGLYID